MIRFFERLFSSDFMPHGGCYFWRPDLVWLHASSDAIIAIAYFLTPFSLILLVRRRKDLQFNWMFVLFGVFILACGLTHVMGIWNIWHSAYRLEGVIKAITALASLPTALLMLRLVPKIVALPSPERLRKEIEERIRAEREVRVLNAELERRVEERTALLKRSNEALQRFAYIASHDLQEPIRNVKTMNQLLARDYKGRLDAKAHRYISFVVEASDRMQNLVSDLLTYSRNANSEGPKDIELASAAEAVNEALQELTEQIEQTKAAIRHQDLPPVRVSRTQLKLLFQNLIGNAIKYSKKSEAPRIEISADMRGEECLFAVSDNGIGIDPKYASQIFVAFKRLHGKEYPGSGVGLTICKDIVEEYGGRIWVKSEPDVGSTFYFTLPIPVPEAVPPVSIEQRSRNGA